MAVLHQVRPHMIMKYKILKGIDREDRDRLFERRKTGTRGHNGKWKTEMSGQDVRGPGQQRGRGRIYSKL